MEYKNHIFKYEERIIFKDDLSGFEDLIGKNNKNFYTICFEFQNIKESLRKLKKIILRNKKRINFDYLYFYNAWDFINIILEKPIYLPSNINLFISETCPIGCSYCNNPNDIHIYLSFEKIKNFLLKYNIGDNINFNILGQGDPIFNPDLFKILEFLKNKGVHITFFSGGKSLLFLSEEKFKKINKFVDEFKINISASNYIIYNKNHKNKITEKEFNFLLERFKLIASKSTFINIITSENINNLLDFILFYHKLGARNIEIKKDLHYPKNYILDNKIILNKVEKILGKFLYTNIGLVSNIGKGYINIKETEFDKKRETIIDRYINNDIINTKGSIDIKGCYQFGNSLDITEDNIVSLCCHYKEGKVSDLNINKKYYYTDEFINKYNNYLKNKKTPESCKKCPISIDRYKNFVKYNFINNL